MCLEKLKLLSSSKNSLTRHCVQKLHIAVTHLKPCFLTTLGQHKYFKVFFEKSGAFKYKYIHKPLLSQNLVHFT